VLHVGVKYSTQDKIVTLSITVLEAAICVEIVDFIRNW